MPRGPRPPRRELLTRRQALQRLASGVATATAALCRSDGATAQGSRPNIILIVADDLGYRDLGSYGAGRIRTPHLDALASRGTRFTDFYAGMAVCAPSRCCLMTGLHSGHALIRRNERIPLRPQDTTVAEVLKQAGYATGMIGKWGLGLEGTTGIPNLKGFDQFVGHLNQGDAQEYYATHIWRNDARVEIPENRDDKQGLYIPDLLTDEAIGFIRGSAGKPFFLYLAYALPHSNNRVAGVTGDGMQVPSYAPYTDKPWPKQEKGFAAMITRLDAYIGRIMSALRAEGMGQDTCVFFTSDNGPHSEGGHRATFFNSGGPLRGIKRDLYEGGIRVPMIAHWPGMVPSASVSGQVWSFWDFLPTAADMAGATPPAGLDGVSILPALLGARSVPREHLYWEAAMSQPKRAVRRGKWKAVQVGANPTELYDLEADIGESRNLASGRRPLVADLEALMDGAHTSPLPRLYWVGSTGYELTGVSPRGGNPRGSAHPTEFVFKVRYVHFDGELPTTAVCTIERLRGANWRTHQELLMLHESGEPPTGAVFAAATTFPNGVLRYRFRFAAPSGAALGEPTEFQYGPLLTGPPELTWAGETGFERDGVEPNVGSPGTRFDFRVLYRDSRGNPPTVHQLVLRRDGKVDRRIELAAVPGGSYRTGKVFGASEVIDAPGDYEYRFRFRDATGPASGPPSRWQPGPLLEAAGGVRVMLTTASQTGQGVELAFVLSHPARVSLEVCNLAGRQVRLVVDGKRLGAGRQSLLWDRRSDAGLPVPNGVYLMEVTARAEEGTQARALGQVRIGR